jgi:splicing factor 1
LQGFSISDTEAYLIRQRLEQLGSLLAAPYDEAADLARPNRPPSPEPVYDDQGKRVNLRPTIWKQRLLDEKKALIAKAAMLSTNFAKANVGVAKRVIKYEHRLMFPTDKFPGYNFQGVLIGPRGSNQKRLELETKCKIAVRGEGTRKRKDGIRAPGDEDPIHAFITANCQEDLDAGIAAVTKLLTPVSTIPYFLTLISNIYTTGVGGRAR